MWDIGDAIRLKVTCKDVDDALKDPTTITLKVKIPSGTTTIFNYPADLQNESVGIYYYDYPITVSGKHIYLWITTGDPTQSEEGAFTARHPNVS